MFETLVYCISGEGRKQLIVLHKSLSSKALSQSKSHDLVGLL